MRENKEKQEPISPKILYETTLQGMRSRAAEAITHRYQEELTKAYADAQKQALQETMKTCQEGLPQWVVSKRTSDGYFFLASYLGQVGEDSFFCIQYGEVMSGKVAENEAPLVDTVRELSGSQTQAVLDLLETNSQTPQPDKIVAPPGFYVFQFAEKDKRGQTISTTKVVRHNSFKGAVRELKRNLIYIHSSESYQDFKIYREGRWDPIETDPRTEAIGKDILAKTRFRLSGQTEEFDDKNVEEEKKYRFALHGNNTGEGKKAYGILFAAGVTFIPPSFDDHEPGYSGPEGKPYLKDSTGRIIAVGITEIETVAQTEQYLQEEYQSP